MAEITAYSNCEPLPLSDPAYDEISKGVRASWPQACITMIDRISIPHLHGAYEDWRKQLEQMEKEKKDDIHVAPISREFTAYHGTREVNVESICKNGFQPAEGKVMAYGYGIYFAKNFSMSWNYSGQEQDETKMSYIFVCKLLPGRIQAGQANTKPSSGYHSRADMPSAPNIFAIPEVHMMIPEYLVRFSKRSEMGPLASSTGYIPDEKAMLKRLKDSVRRIETAEKKKATKKKST
jgi:hypothetical protein